MRRPDLCDLSWEMRYSEVGKSNDEWALSLVIAAYLCTITPPLFSFFSCVSSERTEYQAFMMTASPPMVMMDRCEQRAAGSSISTNVPRVHRGSGLRQAAEYTELGRKCSSSDLMLGSKRYYLNRHQDVFEGGRPGVQQITVSFHHPVPETYSSRYSPSRKTSISLQQWQPTSHLANQTRPSVYMDS